MILIFSVTIRQLVRRRVSLVTSLFCLSPVLLAIVYRLSDSTADPERWTARVLFSGLVVAVVLPLAALIYGTSSLGNEIEDGTASYILAKPVPRWKIAIAKSLAAWAPCALSVFAGVLASGLITFESSDRDRIVLGFSIAVILGSLVYCLVFVLLSLITSRALIIGLVYVVLWEGAITSLFGGARVFSVRQYSLGVADLVSQAAPRAFRADLGGIESLALMALVAALASFLTVRRLSTFEVREKN